MWAQIINTLIGIWLTASPGIFNYKDSGADSNHIIGPVIATIAMVACWETTRGLRKLNIPLGLWVWAAPWILGYQDPFPIINDMACGILVITLAFVRGQIKGKYGEGWKIWKRRQNV
ncbi:SPW repeat domain-containing protein [Pedobacter ginsengisoli]|uniref:SPW repeat domain-containing protein n=1 Tax=Pedobacter ginsengisoli TaxID=363852 RepID=UPI00254A83F5|nr:SPW repeat protein [Pedobacter ginsengisoli]